MPEIADKPEGRRPVGIRSHQGGKYSPFPVILGPFIVILGLDPRIGPPRHLVRLLSFLGVSRDPRVEPEDDDEGAEDDGHAKIVHCRGLA